MDYAKNKNELIDSIAKETTMNKSEAKNALNAVLSGISRSLAEGKALRFLGFGTFSVQARVAQQGRNPRTGDVIQIAAYKKPLFKAGQDLKVAVNTWKVKAVPQVGKIKISKKAPAKKPVKMAKKK